MTAEGLTAVLGGMGSVIVAIATYYGTIRSSRKAAVDSTIATWKDLSAERKVERDEARQDLADIDGKYRARIRDIEQDYQAQINAMRARITQLESDLAATRDQGGAHYRQSP